MRILHTADLHLGRQFNGLSLDDDQAAALDQIVEALIARSADVLVIAGDVFDRAAPPATAVRQFNAFLTRVARETKAAVVAIAGNHDSADRIAAMAVMPDARRALIRGAVLAEEEPLVLEDEHGAVAFSGLPFAYEHAAKECFSDETIETPAHVMAAQIAAARRALPAGARWVIVAHAFVTGAQPSDSERPLTRVGGVETVGVDVFDGAHYVALGHIHRPQTVTAEHIRYSGSPLAFGFDEADCPKSMALVELDGAGAARVEIIPFRPLREVRVLRGRHAELLLAEPSSAIVKVVLTDETPVIDAMKRLRAVFPNACALTYERDERAPEVKAFTPAAQALADPIDVVGGFLEHVRGEAMNARERELVADGLQALRETEDAA